MDESKLSLAVYTPELKSDEKKPVMVWIHGGGWQFGSAESYNGAALSKYGDVVVVILSYRPGINKHVGTHFFERLLIVQAIFLLDKMVGT